MDRLGISQTCNRNSALRSSAAASVDEFPEVELRAGNSCAVSCYWTWTARTHWSWLNVLTSSRETCLSLDWERYSQPTGGGTTRSCSPGLSRNPYGPWSRTQC